MKVNSLGVSEVLLQKFDDEYLRWTLNEIPVSPMMEKSLLDEIPLKYLDIPYDIQSEKQKIDLYLPPEAKEGKTVPLLIFIHGGGFFAGDKRDMQISVYLGALNYGYALASVNYRLSDEVSFPEPVKDCKAAIRHLRKIAPQYNIDPSRFAVAGNSAGGYLSLMIAVSPNVSYLEDSETGDSEFGTEVRCAIATYPCVDFSLVEQQKLEEGREYSSENPELPEAKFLGAPIASFSKEELQKTSPAHYITLQVPPLMVKAGSADTIVPCKQSVYFADQVRKIAGEEKIYFELVHGAGHHDPAFKRADYLREALKFMDQFMK